MSKLKSFDEFVNENLVAKGEYNFYGPGSLKPLVQKLVSEGKNESIIRTYLTSIGVVPWRIDKVMMEMAETITIEKKVNESINEGKKMKPFKKVKVGDKATDYNGDVWGVLAVGKVKDLMKYDDSGAAEELDPNEDAIALDGRGGTAVFSYDPDGAAVYEAKKAKLTFEENATKFLKDINEEEEEVNEKTSVKKGDYVLYKGNGTQWTKSKVMQVIPSAKKLHIDWNDEYIEVHVKDVKPVKESIDEGFEVKKLDKGDNYDWEFEIKDPVDKKLYKELKINKIEFGTLHGKLVIMGDGDQDNAVPAIRILAKFGIRESVNEGKKTKIIVWTDKRSKKQTIDLDADQLQRAVSSGHDNDFNQNIDTIKYDLNSGDKEGTTKINRYVGGGWDTAYWELKESVNEAKKKTFEDATAAFLLGLQGSDVVNDDETVDEAVGVLTIAGGIVLGVVGVIALINGVQVAAIVAGKAIVNAADKADAKNAAKRAASKLADKKAILEPIAKKFENDEELKKMYAELTPYMGTSNAKNRASAKLRRQQMAAIAKYIKTKLTPEELSYFTDLSKYLRTGTFENNEFYLDAKRVNEKLNKKTLQVEEGDGEDIDDMIDDLADGDEDETQGPDDSAPDGEDSPESKIKDGESPADAVEGDDDASSKIAAATKELEKDSKKLAKLKKILLDESSTNEELTRMVNDGAMSELHLLAKEAKDEADFLKKAKSFAKDMDIKIEGGLEKMFKEFYSDMKNESVKETKEVTIDDDGKEVEDEENITDTKTGDEIQVEEPQEESTSNAYMDAVTEGLKHRFNK